MITGKYPGLRLRRSRKNDWSRRLIEENNLSPVILFPNIFIDGKNKNNQSNQCQVYRYTLDKLSGLVDKATKSTTYGCFISIYRKRKKNNLGTEALNEDNLVCKAIQLIKKYKIKLYNDRCCIRPLYISWS